MHTREVPRSDWARYLTILSGRKADHPVRIRVEGEDVGDQTLAECLPLVGISLEEKGSEKDAIELTVARPAGENNLTHQIEHPERVYVEEDDAGEPKVLDIEDHARVKTLVFFEEWAEIPENTGT